MRCVVCLLVAIVVVVVVVLFVYMQFKIEETQILSSSNNNLS